MNKYDDYIGVLLYNISKTQRNMAQAEFNQLGLHAGQERVLLSLTDDASRVQSELVNDLCVEPPTVTKMLQRMEKAGLVERHQDGEDGRATRVSATAQGKALQEPILEIWNDLEKRMVANMSVTEQTLLRRLLMQVLTNLTTEPGEA
ncbi:MAG: MarR family winged helix-turn-helix transcriptional regulator [Chloroflexi bacterium]|nr:MarR family winged helix-turn-helix transcriptional regulator [Chloroflexota bacterium]MCC6895022.1 winged helix-turn-helix transcriptional regulator [Anaerolineae bacterium]